MCLSLPRAPCKVLTFHRGGKPAGPPSETRQSEGLPHEFPSSEPQEIWGRPQAPRFTAGWGLQPLLIRAGPSSLSGCSSGRAHSQWGQKFWEAAPGPQLPERRGTPFPHQHGQPAALDPSPGLQAGALLSGAAEELSGTTEPGSPGPSPHPHDPWSTSCLPQDAPAPTACGPLSQEATFSRLRQGLGEGATDPPAGWGGAGLPRAGATAGVPFVPHGRR